MTFISPADNKRADGCLWHIALGARGVAIDVTIWSDFTLACPLPTYPLMQSSDAVWPLMCRSSSSFPPVRL